MAPKASTYLFSKDYAGLYPLSLFIIKCLSITNQTERRRITLSVFINLIAVLINIAAIAVLYRALKIYFDNEPIFDWLQWLFEMNAATRLFLLLIPAFVLMLVSSLILRLGRVQISRFVLNLKDIFSDYFTHSIDLDPYYERSAIEPTLNGIFGAVRALFLNLFAIIQAILCFIAILFLDPITSLFIVLFFAIYTSALLLHHEKRKTEAVQELVAADAVEDEFLGLTSKSFERLEKMRFFGRNMNSALLVAFVVFAITFQRGYTNTLYDFMLIFLLLRYVGQVLVPLSVLSAAVYPFQKKAYCFINMMNIQKLLANRSCEDSIVALLMTRDAGNRDLFMRDEEQIILAEKIGVSKVFVGTARFVDEEILSQSQLHSFLLEKAVIKREEGDIHARVLFSI